MGCEIRAGTIISDDDSLIAILHQRDAAEQLQRVFEHGMLEGKMYALAGLREVSRDWYERDVAQLAASASSVVRLATVERGVILGEAVQTAVGGIQPGAFTVIVQMCSTASAVAQRARQPCAPAINEA